MTVNFANGGEQKYSSNIVNINHFTDATRNITTPTAASSEVIEFDFTKTAADTNIIIWGYTPVSGQNSYHAGCFVEIGLPSSSTYTRYYDAAHYISPVGGAGDDNWYNVCHWNGCWNSTDTGLNTAGTKRLRLGWATRGGSSERPGNIWNPDKRSSRIRERTTQITVMEVYGNINKFT
tara:strand:- start:469 stop:1002 length:534 start_codon:yes stop_codon:yes gene_type:complete